MADKKSDVWRMERLREFQTEVGVIADRFFLDGLPAACILDAMSAESEIWLARTNREEAETAAQNALQGDQT